MSIFEKKVKTYLTGDSLIIYIIINLLTAEKYEI